MVRWYEHLVNQLWEQTQRRSTLQFMLPGFADAEDPYPDATLPHLLWGAPRRRRSASA
jgi:hypothetical protein